MNDSSIEELKYSSSESKKWYCANIPSALIRLCACSPIASF